VKALVRFYSDPGIAFPRLGWGIRLVRDRGGRGLGVCWHRDAWGPPGVYVAALFWCGRVEIIVDKPNNGLGGKTAIDTKTEAPHG
jgi:hypothetical protein